MKFQKQNTPKLRSLNRDSGVPSCPLLNISKIDEHGMVLETMRGFEVGSTIVMGFHLQGDGGCAPDQQVRQEQEPLDGSSFINVEAIVVESKAGSGSAGQPVYLVTILFSQISRQDREILLQYSSRHSSRSRPQSPRSAPPAPAGEANEKLCREVPRRIHLN